jgi:hypothetical protein
MPGDGIPEEMVDAFFDRELTEGARDRLFSQLRSDLPRCADVAQTQRIISMLREPVEAPDVSGRVLAELSRRRRFLPERLRRMVTTGRLVAAGVGLAAVLTVAVIDRLSPGTLRLTVEPRPVGGVVASSSEEARQNMAHLTGALTGPQTDDLRREALAAAHNAANASVGGNKQVYLVQTLKPGVTTAKLLSDRAPKNGDSIVVYRGAGPDTRFTLPEAVYIDRNAAILLPLGHMSPSKAGMMGWAGVSDENLFLLPAVGPDAVAEDQAVGGGAASQGRAEEKRASEHP